MILFLLIIIIGLYFILSSNKKTEEQDSKKPSNLEAKNNIPQKQPEKPSSVPSKPKTNTESRRDPSTDPEQTKQRVTLINNGEFTVRSGIEEEPSVFPKPTTHPINPIQPIEPQPESILPCIRDLSFNQKIIKLTRFYEKELFRAKYKDAIVEGQKVCPYDGYPLFKANNANYEGVQYRHCLACEKCKTIFPYNKPKKDGSIDFSLAKNILYVVKLHTVGQNPNHIAECVTGILYNKDGKSIRINVNCCQSCRYYYIYYSEYLQYQLIYGHEYFYNIQFKNGAQPPDDIYGDVESILHKHGYKVNANENLPHNVRISILEDIISMNIVTKEIVISYLSYFINRSRNNSKLKNAVSKWAQDLEYIQKFNMDSQPEVKLYGLRKRSYR